MKSKQKELTITEMQNLVFDCMKYIHQFCVDNSISYYMIGGTLLGAIRSKDFIPWDEDADLAMQRKDYERFFELKKDFDNDKYFIEFYRSYSYTYCFHMRVCIRNTSVYHKQYAKKYGRELQVDIFPLDNPPISEKYQKKQVKVFTRSNLSLYFKSIGYGTRLFTNIKRFAMKVLLAFCSTKKICKTADYVARDCFGQEKDCDHLVSMASHYSYSRQYMKKEIYGKPTLYPFRDSFFFGVENYDKYLKQIYGDNYIVPQKDSRELDASEKKGFLFF